LIEDDAQESGMDYGYGGFIGFIILVLDIWALVRILQSGASTGVKVLWIVIILFLPVLGFLLWLLVGPK
jgi:hypothetical protein